ncbi:MAG TPA: hypothetical protein VL993_06245 [Stellaceae bacterium]|nr:hypothetical protein [Stellaceae bacterium]
MDEPFTSRDAEANQIIEENAMLDHLVRTFHREPFVPAAPRRWRAQPGFERMRMEGGSRR